MDNFDSHYTNDSLFTNNPEIKSYLSETSKWGKFLSIVGYIFMGIFIFSVIGIFLFVNPASSGLEAAGFPFVGIMILFYVIFFFIYLFPITYLYRFSTKMKKGMENNDMETISTGFENLKSFFKFFGVFTAIILAIYAIIFVMSLLTMSF